MGLTTVPMSITIFQCLWALWWARLHMNIRRGRVYSTGRILSATDSFYRFFSPVLYLMQNTICIASLWSNSPWLLKFHDSNSWRIAGVVLFLFGSLVYWWALRHLGSNYSPCYDSYSSVILVKNGPYRWIRHPMYAAKLLIGAATLVLSGSLWFVPTTVYFFGVTLRSLFREEQQLSCSLLGYIEYQRRTTRLVPWLYIFLVTLTGCTTLHSNASQSPEEAIDLSTYRPDYPKWRKTAKKRLEGIEKQLAAQEERKKDTSCARQILRELRWQVTYTANSEAFERKFAQLEKIISGSAPSPDATKQSKEDGSWGICYEEWFLKLDISSDHINDLAAEKQVPQYHVKILDRINSPKLLVSYLDSILVSDIAKIGINHRKELNYAVSALMRLILRDRPSNYKFHPDLKKTLKDYLISKWQNPETGFWGAWYLNHGRTVKTDDLSMTFHFASYLDGNVPHLGKIAITTYQNRSLPYPYGLIESGTYTNHHNYDAVRLFRYGWSELTLDQRKEISHEIRKMLDYCLGESLETDGAFKMSPADESLGDAYYFGVSFLDEIGYFDPKKRFWTQKEFPEASALKLKILNSIRKSGLTDYMARNAIEKLQETKMDETRDQ
jgi:protein-S-isoprenylcysteine O-methyltransferase Ste14